MDERKILTTKDLKIISETEQTVNTEHQYKTVNIEDIAPIEKEPTAVDEFSKQLNQKLDKAVLDVKNKVMENNKQYALEKYGDEDALEKESNDEDLELEDVAIVDVDKPIENVEQVEDMSFNDTEIETKDEKDEEFDLDNEETEAELEAKEKEDKTMEIMRSRLKEKLEPVANVVDLSTFTITSKPISTSNALKLEEVKKSLIVDWILFSAKKIISMKEFTGSEIENLKEGQSGRNKFNEMKQIFQIIYDHIVDPNKPASLEAWLKTVSFFDLEHLFFTVYKASFKDANYLPYQCDACNEIFVSEDIPMEDMVKFKTEEDKKEAERIFDENITVGDEYEIQLIQMSDDYVFGFKEPSIYDVIFANLLLDEAFITKWSNELSSVAYIDNIYVIDRENKTLKPVEFKVYPNNIKKTVKEKITTCGTLIRSLSSDQFHQLSHYREAISEKYNNVSYMIPSIKCPKCGHEIKESEISAQQLLFFRHQLVALANSQQE